MIGAGSVVTKDVPSHALVYGNPAEIKGAVCVCGNTLIKKSTKKGKTGVCPKCKLEYRKMSIINLIK